MFLLSLFDEFLQMVGRRYIGLSSASRTQIFFIIINLT